MGPLTQTPGQGRLAAWLVEPFDRTGDIREVARRGVVAMVTFAMVWGTVAASVGAVVGDVSPDALVRQLAINELAILLSAVVTWWLVNGRDVARIASWIEAGHPDAQAPEQIRLAKSVPLRWATWPLVIFTVIGVPTWIASWFFLLEPLRFTIAFIVAGGIGTMVVVWPVYYFISDLCMRPVFTTVAAHAPSLDLSGSSAHSLRTRALLPVPLLTLSTGCMVGGLVSRVDDRTAQIWWALGISAVFTAVYAALLHMVVIPAALHPVDDLTDGIRRVAAGDWSHQVPVRSADEFADLAQAVNHMTGRLADHDAEMRASRARIVTAADESRRRVERDLHDGAQQYLVLMQLELGQLAKKVDGNPAAEAQAERLRSHLDHALAELRDLAHGLYPAVLESDGLPAALKVAGERSPLPTVVRGDTLGRVSPDVEAAVYFCCLEAMQNAAKHAGQDATITVTLGQDDGHLRFEVADNGRGYDISATTSNSGIQNMDDRIGALGGSLTIESLPGRGTAVSGVVPLESA